MYFGESALYLESVNRKDLSPSDFGIPSLKKYPMHDAKHVKLAIKFFNHVDKEHEEELAKNIKKKIKEFNVTDINPSDKNRFFNYYTEDTTIQEASKIQYVEKNHKRFKRPDKCPKCGGEVGVFFRGEPVALCKDCDYYIGTIC